jgi:ATP-dependent RNA helicase DeaD
MSESFRAFDLHPEVLEALDRVGFVEPTPIQSRAIPILLTGQDLIGVAATGTGKTLAYLLPMLQQMDPEPGDPQALVICPTRELAIQVAGEADRFGELLGIKTVLAYGGTSSADQKRALVEGCHLVVATPGRLLDFLTSAWLSTRRVRWAVLDEADRMLDMGFINDVDAILKRIPMSRQTLLFSATFPDEIKRLADRYMLHPELVRMHTGTRVTDKVDHAIYPVASSQRADLLVEILRRENPSKALIFTATREGTSELGLSLRRKGYEVISLSSLLSQANRERVLAAFRKGEVPILVATDVAARGLDITDIDLVVNFDAPSHPEDYVHRIGRTGRAERSGRAITLVTELDRRRVADIERLLGHPLPRAELEDFPYRELPAGPERRRGRGGPRRGGGSSRSRGGSGAGRRRSGSGSRSESGSRESASGAKDEKKTATTGSASDETAGSRRRGGRRRRRRPAGDGGGE